MKGAFARTEIWHVQGEVSVDDSNERDIREMETLGDHLSAEENIDLAGAEIAEDAAKIILTFQGVRIHAGDACRKKLWKSFLDAFGADAGITNGGIAAGFFGTDIRRSGGVAANVADEFLAVAMVCEGNTAIWAASDVTAFWALQG